MASNEGAMKLAYEVYIPLASRDQGLSPIILIHGLFESRKTWKNVAPHIANKTGRKVYAMDNRNHGESGWGRELNFNIMTEDVEEFLKHHEIPKAVVIGHSLGGIIAMNFALRWPEKVEMLILEDTYTKKFKPAPDGVIAQALNTAKVALDDLPSGVDLITAKRKLKEFVLSFAPPEFADTTKQEYYSLDMIPLRKKGKEFEWEADVDGLLDMVSTDKIQLELSGVYEGNTLFLYGSRSFFKIYKDKQIPVLFPKAVLRKIEGASHFIHSECPEAFVNEVSKFITAWTKATSKY